MKILGVSSDRAAADATYAAALMHTGPECSDLVRARIKWGKVEAALDKLEVA